MKKGISSLFKRLVTPAVSALGLYGYCQNEDFQGTGWKTDVIAQFIQDHASSFYGSVWMAAGIVSASALAFEDIPIEKRVMFASAVTALTNVVLEVHGDLVRKGLFFDSIDMGAAAVGLLVAGAVIVTLGKDEKREPFIMPRLGKI